MSLGRFAEVIPTVGATPQVLLRYAQLSSGGAKGCDPCLMSADESGTITVSVQAELPEIPLPTDNISDAFVRLVFSGDNERHTIDVDLDTQIRVPALELTVYSVYPLIDGAVYTQPKFKVHATVGRGTGGNIPATRTVKVGTIGALGSSSIFPVPPYARMVTVARPDVGNGTVVEFYSGSGVVASNLLQSEVMSKYLRNGAGIPNGARFFRLVNQAGVGAANVAAIFELHV